MAQMFAAITMMFPQLKFQEWAIVQALLENAARDFEDDCAHLHGFANLAIEFFEDWKREETRKLMPANRRPIRKAGVATSKEDAK